MTKDDKLLIRCAAINTGSDWLFVYREYLEIFSTACINEPCPIKKANLGRNKANQYLVNELRKRGIMNWREKLNNN